MIKKLFTILLLLVGIGSISSVCATEPTNYPYNIEDMGNGQYNIWTKVNVSANSNKTIYIKKVEGYGPNGDDVFEFFDDFSNVNTLQFSSLTNVEFSNNEMILTGYSETYQKIPMITERDVIIEAKIHAYDVDEWVGFGLMDVNKNGYTCGWYGWSGYKGSIEYWNPQNILIPQISHSETPATVGEYYKLKWVKHNSIISMYDVNSDNNIISEYTSANTDYDIEYIFYRVYKGAKWGYDWIFIRKYANQEPTVSIEQIGDNTWKITIHNPNNQDLTDYQVKLDGTGIVGSKTDSLLLTDNIDTQYLTLTAPDICNINTPVNATVSGYNLSQGTIIYLDWGDGVIDNQIYNGEDLTFQHAYAETGTYTIKAYVNTSITTEKQIIITENLTTGILTFKPLYENTTITGWAIANGMNVSMSKNATVYGVVGEPVKIQTDKGYMTSIPFSTNMTAYIAGSEYQYVTVSLSADNPITVKNGDKIVGYGKNVYITQPVGDTITVWCNNKKIREYLLRSSIDDYIYIPKQHIIANIKENNGILAVYLETWRKEKLHIQVENNNTAIFQTEGYYEGFQRIDTGITPEAGNTYKLTILNEDGNVVAYTTYQYTPESQKPDIPEQEGHIWIAFIIGAIIMIMGVISDNLPIALIGVGLFVLLVPYHMPYLDHLASISTALAIIIIISKHIKRNAGD